MNDVRLRDAVFLWQPIEQHGDIQQSVVVGLNTPEYGRAVNKYKFSEGCVFSFWRKTSHDFRLKMCLEIFIKQIIRDGIHPDDCHKAFWVIPEFRAFMSEDFPAPSN